MVKKILNWLKAVKSHLSQLATLFMGGKKAPEIELTVGDLSYAVKGKVQIALTEEEVKSLERVDLLRILKFKLYHELSHHLYTDDESYHEGHMVLLDIWKNEAAKKGVVLLPKVRDIANFIMNAIEDGRIENIMCRRRKGVRKHRDWYRLRSWLMSEMKDKEPLRDLINSLLDIATMGIYQNGFSKFYEDDEPVSEMLKALIPNITNFVTSSTIKNGMEYIKNIGEITKEIIVEYFGVSKEELEKNHKFMDFLKKQIEEMLKNGNVNFGNNKSSAPNGPVIAILTDDTKQEQTDEGEAKKPDFVIDLRTKKPEQEENKEGSGKGSEKPNKEEPKEESNEGSDGVKNDSDDEIGSTSGEPNEKDEENSSNSSDSCSDSESDGDSKGSDNSSGNSGSSDKENEMNDEEAEENFGSSESDEEKDEKEGDSSKGKENNESNSNSHSSDKPEEKANNSESSDSTGDDSEGFGGQKATGQEIKEAMEELLRNNEEEAKEELMRDMKSVQKHEEALNKTEEDNYKLSSEDLSDLKDFSFGRNRHFDEDEVLKGNHIALVGNNREINVRAKRTRSKIENIIKTKVQEDREEVFEGFLDENALGRFCLGKCDIFRQDGNEEEPEFACLIMKDDSGSMSGSNEESAIEALSEIEDMLKGLIPLKIMTFASNGGGNERYKVIKNWADEDINKSYTQTYHRYNRPSGGNNDAYAIKIAEKLLLKRPEKNKLMIVISDGEPSACTIEDVRNAVNSARKNGVFVISLFMGSKADQERAWDTYKYMYQTFFAAVEPKELGNAMFRFIRTFIDKAD